MNELGEARNDPKGEIPRLIYLLRIVRLCFFSVFTVLVGNLVILGVPQARETILSFQDKEIFGSQQFWFAVSFGVWMVLAWYPARLLVGKRFQPDLVGVCCSSEFSSAVATHLPRVLALIAGLPIALFLLLGPHEVPRLLGLLVLGIALSVFIFLAFRRPVILRHGPKILKESLGNCPPQVGQVYRFDGLHWVSKVAISIAFVFSFGLLLGLLFGMERTARYFGSPALLLFALASWSLFGGLILTYWPKATFRQPAWTWVPALCVLLFASFNENHWVASVAVEPTPKVTRPTLDKAFQEWLQKRPNKADPVIFVASAGGASRAAYWATTTLGLLEDEARKQEKHFAANIFAVSGVSGGSLGAAAFVAAVDAVGHLDNPKGASVRELGNDFTGKDHLATVVGFMLYADLLQRFLPVSIASWDRSLALEKVWERDWQALMTAYPRKAASEENIWQNSNPWPQHFTDLHGRSDGDAVLPMLLLNTSALGRGQRVFQADFTILKSDAYDLLDTANFNTANLTLAQAVHNSARFPFISPVGVVRCADRKDCTVWDRVGDGGYVEASAALGVVEMIRYLRNSGKIVDCSSRRNCNDIKKGVAAGNFIEEEQIRIIFLDNQPSEEHDWLCSAKGGDVTEVPRNKASSGHEKLLLADLLAPFVGAFSTRGGRGATAEFELAGIVNGCSGKRMAELRLPKDPVEREPSMNWMLNRSSQRQMDRAIEGERRTLTVSHANLDLNLNRIRGWLGIQKLSISPRAVVPCNEEKHGS